MNRTRALTILLASVMIPSFLAALFLRSEIPAEPETPLRNVALRRAAWHSSAANYDNTAQLVTDGVIGVLSEEVIDIAGTSASNPTYGQLIPGKVNSGWISASGNEEWVYVDFGDWTRLESITVYWGPRYALSYDLQVSDDAKTWKRVASLAGRADAPVESKFAIQKCRYLRVLCRRSSGENYTIREIKAFGRNSVEFKPAPQRGPEADGSLNLTGGNWTLERASLVDAGGEILSKAGYEDSDWLPATVPGTAFVSWLNAGAVPDPYYDDWQFQASDIFFTSDFWYRNSFEIPASQKGRKVYLNFDAVNWKADVWFNGKHLANALPGYAHSIEGAFIRAKFDVSSMANYGGKNYLAVLIHRNKTPGLVTTQGLAEGPLPNGGELGQDNPTMHAAVGWDWLPTIRGRDIGIYNDVTVTFGGAVRIENPWMETDLDIAETSADISAKNLAIGKSVRQLSGQSEANLQYVNDDDETTQWIGDDIDGAGFTVDLGAATAVSSLQLVWGSETGGAAAAADDRHPAKFKVLVSDDGADWRNFDDWAGGEVNTGWFGTRNTDPDPGTEQYSGSDISNEISGPVATARVSFGGRDNFPMRVPVAQKARYIRFESTKRRKVEQQGSRIVPTRVKEIRIYAETISEVQQSTVRTFRLDGSRANPTSAV